MNDEVERYNVLAIVKGENTKSKQTIVLMGHLDTVDVDDFNNQRDLAFAPDDWMDYPKEKKIPKDVARQLNSKDWHFGRGTLDMKSGLASNLFLLAYYAEHPEDLDGNLVFIAECDEEDSSNGILSAIKTLKKWKEVHQFNYVAVINSDYVAPAYGGDENRYVSANYCPLFILPVKKHLLAPVLTDLIRILSLQN